MPGVFSDDAFLFTPMLRGLVVSRPFYLKTSINDQCCHKVSHSTMCLLVHSVRNLKVYETHDLTEGIEISLHWPFLKLRFR